MPAIQSSKMLEKPIYRQCLHTSSYAKAMLIASTGAGAVVVLLLSAGVKRGQAGGRKRYLNLPISVSAVNSAVADLVDQSTSLFRQVFFHIQIGLFIFCWLHQPRKSMVDIRGMFRQVRIFLPQILGHMPG